MKLYNTRTRSVEEFRPLQPPHVRIYVCGLTPSAEAHAGHARSFLFFDVLRNYLEHLRYDVTFVQNVTDIDDRSIERAKETGEHWYDIVGNYYATFKESMRKLGVRQPDHEPYATQYVSEIVAMIGKLVDKDYAYVSKAGVYYRVAKFPRYGALSGRNIRELEAGARVEIDESKEDPLDFALWKFAKPDEPKWPSPWGEGRPGWHIECSAMSHALLDPPGDGFDIHGGGADLIFPHHENEIAQSEPLMAHPPMANFWLHGGLVQFDSRKMSKSLGNFEPLADLLERFDPQGIRLAFLQTGYRKVMNFTDESVTGAATALDRIKAIWREAERGQGRDGSLMPRIEAALDDDFNTSQALSEIFEYISKPESVNRAELTYVLAILGIKPDDSWLTEKLRELRPDFLDRLHEELGAAISINGETPESAIAQVIGLRARARAEKQWGESDRLRDVLLRCGVELRDEPGGGTTWQAV
ncbi:MAG TPA: cysteine--tRNA ligase [Candidatus Rubrimentiphilum sp.]|nr:cysteine--tRNA ligase [Candidatus Rubrimentiphilum sp.]